MRSSPDTDEYSHSCALRDERRLAELGRRVVQTFAFAEVVLILQVRLSLNERPALSTYGSKHPHQSCRQAVLALQIERVMPLGVLMQPAMSLGPR